MQRARNKSNAHESVHWKVLFFYAFQSQPYTLTPTHLNCLTSITY